MFRLSALAIVLTLVVGQSVDPLCRTWCDPHSGIQAACHDDESMPTARALADVACRMVSSNTGFVTEEPSQGTSPEAVHQAILIAPNEFTPLNRHEQFSAAERADVMAKPPTLITNLRL